MLRIAITGLVLSLALQAAFTTTCWAQAEQDAFTVEVDKARVLRLPRAAAAVVIGNPAIADAIVHDGHMLFITGKIFGSTNIIALDGKGRTIVERNLHVSAPTLAAITYHRGSAQYSYTCADNCAPAPSIGDNKDSFDTLTQQQLVKAEQGNTAAGE